MPFLFISVSGAVTRNIIFKKTIKSKKKKMMQASVSASPRESVIVVMNANRSKGAMDALDWALKRVVRRQDTVIVLGVSGGFGKKNSCFPLNMGISISGICKVPYPSTISTGRRLL